MRIRNKYLWSTVMLEWWSLFPIPVLDGITKTYQAKRSEIMCCNISYGILHQSLIVVVVGFEYINASEIQFFYYYCYTFAWCLIWWIKCNFYYAYSSFFVSDFLNGFHVKLFKNFHLEVRFHSWNFLFHICVHFCYYYYYCFFFVPFLVKF